MSAPLDFFNEFLESEYKTTKAKYTKEISDEEFGKLRGTTKSYYHSIVKYLFDRSGAEFDEDMAVFSEKNKNNSTMRRVFLVKTYQHPTYGEALRRVIKGDKIYGFYCSYHMITRTDIGYSQLFYLADTDEGLKIIYSRSFSDGKWGHSHGYEPMQVLQEGELLEVKKLEAPIDEESLELYNAE